MEELKMLKKQLMSCVQSQMMNPQEANTEELGEVVDMIKDLSETMYYCSIVEAMEKNEEEKEFMEKISKRSMPMYYDGGNNSSYARGVSDSGRENGRRGGRRGYDEGQIYYESGINPIPMYESTYPIEIRDFREGKSGMIRRNYMESKELGHGKEKKMKELEEYIKELSEDITEMIEGASPEEKQILSQKLSTLASKVQ